MTLSTFFSYTCVIFRFIRVFAFFSFRTAICNFVVSRSTEMYANVDRSRSELSSRPDKVVVMYACRGISATHDRQPSLHLRRPPLCRSPQNIHIILFDRLPSDRRSNIYWPFETKRNEKANNVFVLTCDTVILNAVVLPQHFRFTFGFFGRVCRLFFCACCMHLCGVSFIDDYACINVLCSDVN